jgi:oxygen-dependent protoporphyrinogen oxidase
LPRVIIIGGGISGLTIAYRLMLRGSVDVTVLESESRVGGKAYTLRKDGFSLESGSNGWLDKEPAMPKLIESLHLEDRIQPSDDAASRRFIYRKGALRELHLHPLKFMMSGALPLSARLRLAMEPFIKRRAESADDTSMDETLADFATRRLGKGAAELLIGPMASGVYAGDPRQMSLRSCFPKIAALEKAHGGLIRGMIALKKEKKQKGENPDDVTAGPSGRLTSMQGGMSDLVDALEVALDFRIQKNVRAVAVKQVAPRCFVVQTEDGRDLPCDAVISAAPAYAASSFLTQLDEEAASAFSKIPYPALDVVCLAFKREEVRHPLNGFGFLAPRGQGLTILGSLWTSTIFPGRSPKGHVLFRTMIGGMTNPDTSSWDEEQVVSKVREDLEKAIGLDSNLTPSLRHVFRHERAIPQYHVGHSELVKTILSAEERRVGFFVLNNCLGGIAVIDCVRNAEAVATRVSDYLMSAGRN